jgi:hypothetical protein
VGGCGGGGWAVNDGGKHGSTVAMAEMCEGVGGPGCADAGR